MSTLLKLNSLSLVKNALIRECVKPWNLICSASWRHYPLPPDFSHIKFPEQRKLAIYPKVPEYPQGIKPLGPPKRIIDIRGPELVHNQLIYKQYGIVALTGGMLKHNHFETVRNIVNRQIDTRTTFALWRVDAPWKPRTKKSQGKRMGGGKASIKYYVTPVKAGRVIFEIGGKIEFIMIAPLLKNVQARLPFQSAIVTHEIMEEERALKREMDSLNLNPYNMQYIIKKRMANCHRWLTRYDKLWLGRYI